MGNVLKESNNQDVNEYGFVKRYVKYDNELNEFVAVKHWESLNGTQAYTLPLQEQELNVVMALFAQLRNTQDGEFNMGFDELKRYGVIDACAKKPQRLAKAISTISTLGYQSYTEEVGGKIKFRGINMFADINIDVSEDTMLDVQIYGHLTKQFIEWFNAKKKYVQFPVIEYVNGVTTKYGKLLYPILKQYRTTGKVYMTAEDFAKKLFKPDSISFANWVKNKVFAKRTLRQLGKLFEDFSYEIVMKKGKSDRVVMTFKPQVKSNEIE